MRVILFQPQFAELVRDGRKAQTIRKTAQCKPGDRLSLRRWASKAYRSKQEVFREAVCAEVTPVVINVCGVDVGDERGSCPNTLARADGFAGWTEMRDWFERTHGLPFRGVVIEWRKETAP